MPISSLQLSLRANNFLKLVMLIQALVVSLLFLEYLGVRIPLLRQIALFVYLTFIPGMLLLKVLKINIADFVEQLCYSVGFSVAIIMFVGLFTNTVYPMLGIGSPISTIPLLVTFTTLIVLLSSAIYKRGEGYESLNSWNFLLSPSALFLALMPFLGIIGANLVNYFDSNILLMFSLPLAGIVPMLIAFNVIEERLYPMAIFTTSLFLLYHTSLISPHIWGWDINVEYYFSNNVLQNGLWDPSIYGSINGMLAIVILAPSYAILCNIELVWVFKVMYPFLFSFVPIAMYTTFEKMIGKKSSALACFLFMFSSVFYSTMLQLARQQIAELFLILIFLAILSKNLSSSHKFLFLVIFGISLIVSHYGTAYLFMFILIAYFLLLIFNSYIFCFYKQTISNPYKSTIKVSFIVMYVAMTLSWYAYTAGSHPFITLLNSARIIFDGFINPHYSDAFHMLIRRTVSPLHDVTKMLYHVTQILIAAGVLNLLREKGKKVKEEYFLLSIIFFGIWIASTVLPYYGFDFTRVYHVTLIVLSPFFVTGAFTVAKFLKSLTREKLSIVSSQALKIISILLFAFLLFNSGWVYELAKDNPSSFALSDVDYPVFNEQEIAGAKWLHEFRDVNLKIYADDYRWLLIIGFEGYPYSWYEKNYKSANYIFLGNFNIRSNTILKIHEIGPGIGVREYVEASELIKNLIKIYDSGGANVFLR